MSSTRIASVTIGLLLIAVGCGSDPESQRIAELESRIDELESRATPSPVEDEPIVRSARRDYVGAFGSGCWQYSAFNPAPADSGCELEYSVTYVVGGNATTVTVSKACYERARRGQPVPQCAR